MKLGFAKGMRKVSLGGLSCRSFEERRKIERPQATMTLARRGGLLLVAISKEDARTTKVSTGRLAQFLLACFYPRSTLGLSNKKSAAV